MHASSIISKSEAAFKRTPTPDYHTLVMTKYNKAFKLRSVPIPAQFVWRSKYYHLTYSTFIKPEELLAMIKSKTQVQILAWSICWEESDEGYEHTHAAIIFLSRLHLSGSRTFDFHYTDGHGLPDQIHPHILPKATALQMEELFTTYHAGHKFNAATRELEFKEPILHEHWMNSGFDFTRSMIDEAVEAPSLLDACVLAQVRPRTVNDLKTLRSEVADAASKKYKHKYDPESFFKLGPPVIEVLHIYGGTGLGKTKWACAQFRNPCVIKPFNSIGCVEALKKQYDRSVHDGLVLDEADLRFMTREAGIAISDAEDPAVLDARFGGFTLPGGIPKIFISNSKPFGEAGEPDLWPYDAAGAIRRRVHVLHITQPTYRTLPAVPPALAQLTNNSAFTPRAGIAGANFSPRILTPTTQHAAGDSGTAP